MVGGIVDHSDNFFLHFVRGGRAMKVVEIVAVHTDNQVEVDEI